MNILNLRLLKQGSKFLAVGIVNTLIDFGILNILILLTHIERGAWFSVFKALSFTVAVINSYFMNKFWTFRAKEATTAKEFSQFLAVSIVGFFLNVGMASLVVNFVGPKFGVSLTLWANLGALLGTGITFVWNFIGYKFFVFKK